MHAPCKAGISGREWGISVLNETTITLTMQSEGRHLDAGVFYTPYIITSIHGLFGFNVHMTPTVKAPMLLHIHAKNHKPWHFKELYHYGLEYTQTMNVMDKIYYWLPVDEHYMLSWYRSLQCYMIRLPHLPLKKQTKTGKCLYTAITNTLWSSAKDQHSVTFSTHSKRGCQYQLSLPTHR